MSPPKEEPTILTLLRSQARSLLTTIGDGVESIAITLVPVDKPGLSTVVTREERASPNQALRAAHEMSESAHLITMRIVRTLGEIGRELEKKEKVLRGQEDDQESKTRLPG